MSFQDVWVYSERIPSFLLIVILIHNIVQTIVELGTSILLVM